MLGSVLDCQVARDIISGLTATPPRLSQDEPGYGADDDLSDFIVQFPDWEIEEARTTHVPVPPIFQPRVAVTFPTVPFSPLPEGTCAAPPVAFDSSESLAIVHTGLVASRL